MRVQRASVVLSVTCLVQSSFPLFLCYFVPPSDVHFFNGVDNMTFVFFTILLCTMLSFSFEWQWQLRCLILGSDFHCAIKLESDCLVSRATCDLEMNRDLKK